MADDLADAVHLSSAVVRIEQTAEGLRVSTTSTSGSNTVRTSAHVMFVTFPNALQLQQHRRYDCLRVVLALPPSQAGHIRFHPPLPFAKRQLLDGALPQGNLIKFVLTYRKAFWRDDGYSGEVLSTGYTERPGEVMMLQLDCNVTCETILCKRCGPRCYQQILPLLCLFDATTNNGSAALVGFIHNEHWAERSQAERKAAVVQDMVRFLGSKVTEYLGWCSTSHVGSSAIASFAADYEDKNWSLEPFNGGCPVSCVPTGNMQYFQRIREPVNRLVYFPSTYGI